VTLVLQINWNDSREWDGLVMKTGMRAEPEVDRQALRAAVAGYNSTLGWWCQSVGGQVILPLTHGVEAVAVPRARGARMAHVLARWGVLGPVVELSAAGRQWVFLVDANDVVCELESLPPEMTRLSAPNAVLLPVGGVTAGSVRWIVEPDTRRRWLPTLATVLAAARIGAGNE
jgi:hypothetical protein